MAVGLKEKTAEWMAADYRNPSSVHHDGQTARAAVDKARRSVLNLLGCDVPSRSYGDTGAQARLVFTSGGTEANNLVLNSAWQNRGGKTNLLLSRVEHSSVYNCALQLKNLGAELEWIEVDRHGHINLTDYRKKLTSDVFLVSVMLANNETGFVFPIREMAAMAREKGIPFHTDAVCAAGKWPVSFSDLGVDYLSFSSHKFGAIKGVGGLVYRQQCPLSPFIVGGTHEFGKRAGTENVLGILSSAYALEEHLKGLAGEMQTQIKLRSALSRGIREIYPGAIILESPQNLPQTVCACFVGLDGHLLLSNLDLEGVSVSYGSACMSGALEPSRVLKNLNLLESETHSAVRFSFGRGTTGEDMGELAERLRRVVARMQKG